MLRTPGIPVCGFGGVTSPCGSAPDALVVVSIGLEKSVRVFDEMLLGRWFVTRDAEADRIPTLQQLGCAFLVIGTILLPLQVGQGTFFSRYHLQWADGFLGLALVLGALTQRTQVVQLSWIWGAFWSAALLSALSNGTFYAFVRWLGLIYTSSMIGLVPMYFSGSIRISQR